MNLGKGLTKRTGRPRIHIVKTTPLIASIDKALGGRDVSEVAELWGIPRWVIDDIRRGKTKMPSARYLPGVAAGLGITVDTLLARAQEPQPA